MFVRIMLLFDKMWYNGTLEIKSVFDKIPKVSKKKLQFKSSTHVEGKTWIAEITIRII